jgi:energy-converting hydrogenase Eha subunit A
MSNFVDNLPLLVREIIAILCLIGLVTIIVCGIVASIRGLIRQKKPVQMSPRLHFTESAFIPEMIAYGHDDARYNIWEKKVYKEVDLKLCNDGVYRCFIKEE